MKTTKLRGFNAVLVVALVLSMVAFVQPAQAVSPDIVISQVYGGGGNSGGVYTNDFVELFNRGTVTVSLAGWSIQYTSATGAGNFGSSTTLITPLSGSLAAGQYLLIQEAAGANIIAPLPTPDVTDSTPINMSGTGAKVALVNTTTPLGCNGVANTCTPAALATIVDLVGWDGANFYETTGVAGTGPAPATTNPTAIFRNNGGCTDTDNNSSDFGPAVAPVPRNTASPLNPCAAPPTTNLTINDVSLNEGNSGTTSFDFTVSLSSPAGAGGVTFDIATADGTATAPSDFTVNSLTGQTIPAGNSTYTFSVLVNGDTTFEPNETFSVNVANVTGATLSDGQGQGTIVNDDVATALIHDIQGSGSAVTGPGPFTVEAIVVGDYQTQGSGQLRGFFIQEEDADVDANPATSEGIFVFCTTCPTAVSVGDKVRVTGGASEFSDMSQLSATTAGSVTVLGSGNPLPTSASVQLPVPGVPSGDLAAAKAFINAYFEPFEGMLVTFPDTLSVREYFELARYGQVILSEGGRPRQFTDANMPDATGFINHQIDLASRTIILDDTDNRQNRPSDVPNTAYYHPVPGLSISNFFRGGDTITNLTGVLHWSFAGQSGTDAWRIRPVTEAYTYAFTSVNARPTVPDVDGSVKVASFNVLNYFLTIDTSNVCAPTQNQDCRGADSVQELERQRTKMLAALSAIDADIFGFMEMENTPGVEPLADIVAGLPGYDYIDTGLIGTDAIRVGIIYKTTTVQPVGNYAILTSSVDPRFIDTRNRPALAQAFEEIATGGRVTVVVNHLKSKGSGCGVGDDDTTTGQGNCNGTRTLAAQALADWLATDPTGSGDPDALIIGDLNSYAKEDPIVALQNAGYTDMVAAFGAPAAYGYVFDGQLGYLDHALANASLNPQVAEVAEWHINADEIPLFDYNDDVRTADEAAFEEESDALPLYEPNEFRTSDHDPIIIGLNLNGPPTVDAGGPYSVDEGGSVTLAATGSDPNGDTLTYAWDLDNNGSFETSDQSVTFSAATLDGPSSYTVKAKATDPGGLFAEATATVDVLNVAPAATFNAPTSVSEGSPIAISLTDPIDVAADLGSLQYAFDCGAGYGPFGAANTVSCPTVDNGTPDVGGKVVDKDGGVSEYIATVTIYNVPPDVAVPVVSPEPSTEGGSVTASATFTDPGVNDTPFTCTVDYGDGSGALAGTVAGTTCTGPAHVYSTIGGYPVTVSVTDKDGSTGRRVAMHTVIFNWSGFFRPVDNLPALNVVKAGSAIPLKFSLGGNKGLSIFAAGYPQSVQIACDTGAVLGGSEPTANPGGSSLTYSNSGQYNYVWKTEKAWAGTCRQLVVKLIDGTTHPANFRFK